jgi:hypothetical protein
LEDSWNELIVTSVKRNQVCHPIHRLSGVVFPGTDIQLMSTG